MNPIKRASLAKIGMSLFGVTGFSSMLYAANKHAKNIDGQRRVIQIEARKFAFSPAVIIVRKGEKVTLALKAMDFTHGFQLPDFKLRRDLVPGQVVNVDFIPDHEGEFDFLCDNFCGSGHENMSGKLIVIAAA